MARESQLAAFGGESINRRLVVGSEDLESRLGIALALEVELPPNPSSLRIGFIAADPCTEAGAKGTALDPARRNGQSPLIEFLRPGNLSCGL